MRLQSGLIAYLDSVKRRDPAARSRWDVLFYPGVLALGLHRFAHWLWEGRLFFLARLVDRKSTRLNSSHRCISYAVFCLKKKKSSTQNASHRIRLAPTTQPLALSRRP